jgi:hypothetical protein
VLKDVEDEEEEAIDFTRYNFNALQCSDIFNNELKGDYYSDNYWYFNVAFKRNNELRSNELNSWLNDHEVTLIYKDTFSDVDDPDETLKTYINGRTFI